ncbi:hypothetical protein GCM10011390_42770 [Aureimonas endophytica]|uniref:Pyrrolidone-carboxylate peptidase n=1 Tax=Aureimonas endophytica TaxID=2027858 RepID=A0A917EBN2_9HYPH|nr:hypothetical protein [Aureimonas endophytica]GGE19038.1 hypothetical protein GCM10011390_42770 [Aureimonas endophytica]
MLLAGFGAFPGAPRNPAERLVTSFRLTEGEVGRDPARIVLPVEWGRSWGVLAAEIRRIRPVAVLLVGLNARSERFRIERAAYNERAPALADTAGARPPGTRIGEGPARLATRLPDAAIGRALSAAGIGFELSDDPGRYLCNETLYHLCREGPGLGLRHFGFVHTPLTDEIAAETGATPGEGQAFVPARDLDRLVRIVLACLGEEAGHSEADPRHGREILCGTISEATCSEGEPPSR